MNIYKPNIIAFKEKEECDKYTSSILIKEINKLKKIKLGLATGSTPREIYENLVSAYKNGAVSFKGVITFNLDEYIGLKENDYENSYRFFMNSYLFEKVDFNINNTFFPIEWNQKLDLDKNDYFEYDELINSNGGIDIQILGVGENGHIAFNEPGSKLSAKTSKTNLSDSTIEVNSRFFKAKADVPTQAVTMGLDTILKAKRILLVAYGKNKLNALKALTSASGFNENIPCTALLLHNNVTIITDQAIELLFK